MEIKPKASHQFSLDDLLDYLERVVHSFEQHPDEATRESVFGMLQALDTLHREGLQRLVVFLEERNAGPLLEEAAKADRVIYTLMGLYDLLPSDGAAIAAVETALARIRPYIESHGGALTVLSVDEGVVHVEMGGACHNCPGSEQTLQRGVHRALEESYDDFVELIVHRPSATFANGEGIIPLEKIAPTSNFLQAPRFQSALSLNELPPKMMRQVELEGMQILLVNVENDIYAVGAFCPGSMLPLVTGTLSGYTLTCAWHGEVYDIRDGRCLESERPFENPALPVYPVAIQRGEIQVAVNVTTRPLLMKAAGEGS